MGGGRDGGRKIEKGERRIDTPREMKEKFVIRRSSNIMFLRIICQTAMPAKGLCIRA